MKEKLSYKEAMAEIEQVVASLEENKLDVDELGVKVKRVSELLAFCKAKLHDTEEEVENILKTMEE
ncbi:exodeoxyribonuclease VII small subunit [Phocaeicola sartorii]|uniref:exodeoxyribonuclease VII small subunit n=1 Tax=Phocaeicola sartorii TaxID=671267 RepID=UPI0025A9962B|nr:exodeoxyribonuclease VII small subunit [Phocaeicola sartorii]